MCLNERLDFSTIFWNCAAAIKMNLFKVFLHIVTKGADECGRDCITNMDKKKIKHVLIGNKHHQNLLACQLRLFVMNK